MSNNLRSVNFATLDEDKKRAEKRANGDSLKCTNAYARHRRSKSASERNSNLSRVRDSSCTEKHLKESPEVATLTNSRRVSPLHENSCGVSTNHISNHRASLEKDVEQLHLRLQQEKYMRMLLERAMGRASSTLSPGHRHFAAQTKELIAEIELLEEEVTNREQQILMLYRSIFENSVSRPNSEHSSVVTSPAHAKSESRKHPSIISSAFCSSKKFPLRTFHSLASANYSGKRNLLNSKTRHASLLSGKERISLEKSCSAQVKEPVPTTNCAYGPRTLKDHLYQCPSKLSEEMVRCMAAVYFWLGSTSSANSEQNHLPVSSELSINDRSVKSAVEISWITTDKRNFSRASYAIDNYRGLVEQLDKVNVQKMDDNAQIAFWINLYNTLVMHAYLAYGIPHNSLRRLALFHKAAYKVGGHIISPNTIESSIFCFRTPRVGQWLETVLSTAMRKRSGEEKQLISSKFGLRNSQPLVCFALCTGAFSDPMLKVYTASNIKDELEAAKRDFLQANTVVKKSKRVILPKIIEKYAKEACIPLDDLLDWVSENVDKKLCVLIKKCLDHRPNKKASHIIKWSPYCSRFRYVFSKDLTEKPWWA